MAFPQGVDFRATANFVTDPTNYTSDVTGSTIDYPTTSPQGNNIGWESGGGAGTKDVRDRNNAIDVRVAGISFVNPSTTWTFRMDLPATGKYGIQGAFGDNSGGQGPFTIQFKDTTTVFATPVNNAATGGADQYYAANGTLETSNTNWATNNPNAGNGTDEITNTFSSTIFRIVVTASSSAFGPIASIFIRSIASAVVFRRTLLGLGTRVGSRQMVV